MEFSLCWLFCVFDLGCVQKGIAKVKWFHNNNMKENFSLNSLITVFLTLEYHFRTITSRNIVIGPHEKAAFVYSFGTIFAVMAIPKNVGGVILIAFTKCWADMF